MCNAQHAMYVVVEVVYIHTTYTLVSGIYVYITVRNERAFLVSANTTYVCMYYVSHAISRNVK